MATYDGHEMLRKHLRGERPDGSKSRTQGEEDESIDVKIKQFYDVKTKIDPFYSGGKICVLSPCHFVCKSGPAVNVILIQSTTVIKKDEDGDEDEESTSDKKDDEAEPRESIFEVYGHFETQLDEIISFDACPITFTLITAHKSQLLRKWDLNTKQIIQTVKSFHTTPIVQIEINKAQSILTNNRLRRDELVGVAESQEKERNLLTWATIAGNLVKIWDDGGNTVSKNIKIPDIASIGFVKWDYANCSAENQLLVAERNIYIIALDENGLNGAEYKVVQTLEGHFSQVTGIEWTGDGTLISGGRDKVIILWTRKEDSFEYEKSTSFVFPGEIASLNLLCGKDLYVMATSPNCIKHFDTTTNKLSSTNVLEWADDEVIAGAYSALTHRDQIDEIYIVTHMGLIYRVGKKKLLPKISKKKKKHKKLTDSVLLEVKQQYVGSLDEISSIVLWEKAPGDTKIAVANNTSIIKVYDMNFGNCQFLRGHTDIVLTLFAKDDWLVSGSKDNKVICWKADSLTPTHILEGHLATVNCVCIDPMTFIVYSVSEDNFLRAWNTEKCIRSKIAHEMEIHIVDCSPNGEMLVTGSRDKTAKIWFTKTFELKGTLKGHTKSIWDAKFSKWDRLVVTGSADTTLKIWDITTLECIKTLQGHQSSVLQCLFINSGLQVLSSSADGTWKSWDIRAPLCVSTLECSTDKVYALTSTSDGSLVVTGTADSVLTLWNDVTQGKADEKLAMKKRIIEDDQTLSNVIRKGKWNDAIRLAIELDRPFTLLKIIRGIKDISELKPIIKNLDSEHKMKLIDYIKQWNTNTRTSTEAQILLNTIILSSSPSELNDVPILSLLPYTEKHFQRLQKSEQFLVLFEHLANYSTFNS